MICDQQSFQDNFTKYHEESCFLEKKKRNNIAGLSKHCFVKPSQRVKRLNSPLE